MGRPLCAALVVCSFVICPGCGDESPKYPVIKKMPATSKEMAKDPIKDGKSTPVYKVQ